jgi:hypothetical protein
MAEAWEFREDNSFNVVQVSRREARLPICRTMWVDGEVLQLPALRMAMRAGFVDLGGKNGFVLSWSCPTGHANYF